MPDQADPEILEIVGSQVRQYAFVDRVVAKRRFVLLQAEAVEPGCDIHTRLPAVVGTAHFSLTGLQVAREE